MTITLAHYLVLGAILFAIGVVGVFLNRKNLIVLLMSLELILLAVNMNFIAFSHYLGDLAGQVFVFFILTVAAAEAAIAMLEDMEVKTISLGDALDYNPADGVEIGYSEGPAVSPEEAKALADFGSMVANGQYVQPAV